MLARVIAISDRQNIEDDQLHCLVEKDFCLTEHNGILQELFDNEFEFLDRIFESDAKKCVQLEYQSKACRFRLRYCSRDL